MAQSNKLIAFLQIEGLSEFRQLRNGPYISGLGLSGDLKPSLDKITK